MAYTTVDDPSEYFQTALYTGNAGTNNIVNGGNSDLQPDWVWTKNRATNGKDHGLFDSSRGVTKQLNSNNANSENTVGTSLTAFNSDGFTLGADGGPNANGDAHVAWQWKANGGSRTTFTESGNNPAGGRQANTTAGFSIVDYVGTGAAGTLAHGLGAVPEWIIVKGRSVGNHWRVYHSSNTAAPETDALKLNDTNATADFDGWWNDTAPTSSVFTVGNDDNTNENDATYIAYCFAPIKGYSKFGKYVGNADNNGTFVHTGFSPAWLMIKRTDSAQQWNMHDNKRKIRNQDVAYVFANSNAAEATSSNLYFDFLSNGFKLRNGDDSQNSGTYVYMAFAHQPFVSSKGTPTTAR